MERNPIAQNEFASKAENKIRVANERLRYLLSSTSAVIYTAKVSGSYGATFISNKVADIVGYGPLEFIENPNLWIDNIHPDDKKRILNELPRIFEQEYYTYEYRFRHKNGSYVWVRDEMKLVRDKNGEPLKIVGFWLDISKQKKAEEELEILNQNLLKANKRLKQLALRDPQTGLYNHHYMNELIEAEYYRASRYGSALSVIMLDIDYFKSINDAYGHRFGDIILKQFARYLRKMIPKYDVLARFGGEEFVIISIGADRKTAVNLAQRVLDSVNTRYFGNQRQVVHLKLSIGVSSYPENNVLKGMDLIDLADKCLNKAKVDGGNRAYYSSNITPINVLPSNNTHGLSINDVNIFKGKIEKLTKGIKENLVESIFAFAKTIELKDHFTGEHVEKTVSYAIETAQRLNLSTDLVEQIRQAAVLHDLGKIGIAEKILLKKSKLTKKEFESIKKHPQIAVDILRPIHLLHNIIPLIFYHHERWDGKGYPVGLKGKLIPIGARIIALSDVYQALVSNRPYRKAHSKQKALEIIRANSGTQFDPKIVDIFLGIVS